MSNQLISVNTFYDSIAPSYNGHMTDADKKVRESVHQLFAQNVAKGNILDFGGGTGLDLPWLLDHQYNVFFLEPSQNMRSIARENDGKVTFIETNTDFTKWTRNNLPFTDKVNGILANFAVLNCIEDLDLLFEKFALVASDNCCVITTIIDPRFSSMVRNYSTLSAFRTLTRSRLRIYNKYDEKLHPTYIHSLRSIKHATKNYFNLHSIIPLEFSTFAVLVFNKK